MKRNKAVMAFAIAFAMNAYGYKASENVMTDSCIIAVLDMIQDGTISMEG